MLSVSRFCEGISFYFQRADGFSLLFSRQHWGGESGLTSCVPHVPLPERLGRQHRAELPANTARRSARGVAGWAQAGCFLASWEGGPVPLSTGFGLREGCPSGRRETLGRRPSKDQMVTGGRGRRKYIHRGIRRRGMGGRIEVTASFAHVQLLGCLTHKALSTPLGAGHTDRKTDSLYTGSWVKKLSPPIWGLLWTPHMHRPHLQGPREVALAPSGREGVQRGAP